MLNYFGSTRVQLITYVEPRRISSALTNDNGSSEGNHELYDEGCVSL